MKFQSTVLSLFALTFGVRVGLSQQTPSTAFNYQGTLTRFGAAVTGLYDFQFVLRDAAINGNQLGITNIPQILVSNGLFATSLDFGASSFPGGALRWLDVAVRTNGSAQPYSVLVPTQRVNPSPYAIHSISASTASSASLLGGANWSAILADGATDPLNGKIAGSKIEAGGITAVQLANGSVTASQLAPASVTSSAIANRAISGNQIASGAISISRRAIGRQDGNGPDCLPSHQ